MKIVIGDPVGAVKQDIEAGLTRDDVAKTYALALRRAQLCDDVDWKAINTAIIENWSVSGLVYIKERAWAKFKGREEF